MAYTHPPVTGFAPQAPTDEPRTASTAQAEALIRRAAELAVEEGIDAEAFMARVWAAYLDAKPGLREELEDKELRSQLKKLRKRGLIAEA